MSDEQVNTYFNKLQGEVAAIALALRILIQTHGKSLTCQLAWGFPCWSGNERILSIIAHKDRCNVQLFYGNQLAERWPERIEGTGKQMRHIKIRDVEDINQEFVDILKTAIKLDREAPSKVR